MGAVQRMAAVVVAAAMIGSTSAAVGPEAAHALSSGLSFSADDLPTWQTDGVVFATAASGSKVVVGGSFKNLRPPAGSSVPGLPLTGLAVLDADSGEPAVCQLPVGLGSGGGTVFALNASPNGQTVYVGGNFTSIGGESRTNVAAIDVASCTVLALEAKPSTYVYGLASTNDTVYLAGLFGSVDGNTRRRFAAVEASTGELLPWTADADGDGRAVAVSPDGKRVALGGAFSYVNGSYSHSIVVVNAVTGANVHNFAPSYIEARSVTKTIVSDGSSFYVGNEGTGSGVFDGRIAIDWSNYRERWRDECLGATQAVLPYRGLLYSATHTHNCRTERAFPEGTRKYFLAQSLKDGSFRAWTPEANDGAGPGVEGIGPRGLAVATGTKGSTYLYAVGEFTKINGHDQQGITRFSDVDLNAPPTPTIQVEALRSKALQVRILSSVDNDDLSLTYRVYRNGKKIWTGSTTSWWWTRPQLTFTDKSVTVGKTYSYEVSVSDGSRTSERSRAVSAKVLRTGPAYPSRVIADGAQLYWRFDEPSGTRIWHKGADSQTSQNGLLGLGTQLGVPGVIPGNTAARFDGDNDYAWNDRLRTAPTTYTVEAWFKTTTTTGGKIIGYTNGRPTTNDGRPTKSTNYDRHLYLDDDGRMNFGAQTSSPVALRSARAYNDGKWHHVVGRQGSAGMRLFVDGKSVAKNSSKKAKTYSGVWKVGGDSLLGWPHEPTSSYFKGDIDEVAVYTKKALSTKTIVKHYKVGIAR